MKYLLIWYYDSIRIYNIEPLDSELLAALIKLINIGWELPHELSRYYIKSFEPSICFINENNKVLQLNEEHPYALCESYSILKNINKDEVTKIFNRN